MATLALKAAPTIEEIARDPYFTDIKVRMQRNRAVIAFLDELSKVDEETATEQREVGEMLNCNVWLKALLEAGVVVVLPDIVDYELRRELVLNDAVRAIHRLDQLRQWLRVLPTSHDVLIRAADLWANVRRSGLTMPDRHAIDVDVIIAATTLLIATATRLDPVGASSNAKHISRMVSATEWQAISL